MEAEGTKQGLLSAIKEYNQKLDTTEWEGTVEQYLEKVQEDPKLAQLAHARVLDMIESAGVEFAESDTKKLNPRYSFFAEDLFGVNEPIRKVVKYLKAAASGSQVGRRILLLYGPTSSGKSQMASLLKSGLEEYSRTEAGALYAISDCPIHENPLNAVPPALRKTLRDEYGVKVDPLARLCPICQMNLKDKYNGDWLSIPVKRIFMSEAGRVGIGTFLPGDNKCIIGNSLILTNKGLEPIDRLAAPDEESEINQKIYSMNHGIKNATKSFRYYDKDVLTLNTNLGNSIAGTKNHPLMVVDSDGNFVWREMQNISVGDSVVMSVGSGIDFDYEPMPDNPLGIKEITDNFAKFLGLYIAEGSIGQNNRYIEITNKNENVQKIVKDAMRDIGIEQNLHLYGNIRNMICNKKLVDTMKAFGLGTGAHLKSIPPSLMTSGKLDKILLGMWLGDGNCGKHKNKNTNEASYSTVSTELANQVHLLLFALGVPAKKIFDRKIGTSGAYRIVVSGSRVEDLVYKLNIPSWKLTRPLVDCVNNDNLYLLPQLDSLVGFFVKRQGLEKWYRYSKSSTKTYGRRFSKNSFDQFVSDVEKLNLTDNDKYKNLCNLNSNKFVFATITNIKESKENVYDIEVPDGHNFIANGFVSHNSQSITELVGSVDFSKLGEFGVESDPRAYKFDGELNVANRGIMEMIEMLKVDPKFLYVLLTLAQEKTIKTERFPLIYADEFILSHTNETEYRRFLGDAKLEALHDRIIVCKCPYNLEVDAEVKIYEKLLSEADFGDVHVAPLTLKVAAMFAVLTRLEPAKDQNLTLLKKMQLYNGEDTEGFTAEDVKDIREEVEREGMDGISPRYIFNCIADAFTRYDLTCITPIDLLRSIKDNFENNAKLKKEDIDRFDDLLTVVVEEYTKMAKNEVQKAFFVNFESEIYNLLNNYIDNVGAHLDDSAVVDEFGDRYEPDERLMRSIEEKVGVSEAAKDSFRQEVYRKVIKSKGDGGSFDYKSHARLREALEKQLFDERADTIRLTVSARNPDPEALTKLNQVIETLVDRYGYTAESANQLLRYVNSLMSRTT